MFLGPVLTERWYRIGWESQTRSGLLARVRAVALWTRPLRLYNVRRTSAIPNRAHWEHLPYIFYRTSLSFVEHIFSIYHMYIANNNNNVVSCNTFDGGKPPSCIDNVQPIFIFNEWRTQTCLENRHDPSPSGWLEMRQQAGTWWQSLNTTLLGTIPHRVYVNEMHIVIGWCHHDRAMRSHRLTRRQLSLDYHKAYGQYIMYGTQ